MDKDERLTCIGYLATRPILAKFVCRKQCSSGRSGALIVSVLDSGSHGPGLRPRRGHCVMFLGKTLESHSDSLLAVV